MLFWERCSATGVTLLEDRSSSVLPRCPLGPPEPACRAATVALSSVKCVSISCQPDVGPRAQRRQTGRARVSATARKAIGRLGLLARH